MHTLKKRITAALCAVTILTALAATTFTATAATGGAGNPRFTHTQALASNLDYVNTVYWNDDYGREESYTLRYTPGGDAFPLVLKDETVYGRIDIDEAVAYAENSRGRNVLALANADFFASGTGIPLGVFIEDGIYKSSNETENAIIFREDGTAAIIEKPTVAMMLFNETAQTAMSVNHLNKTRYVTGVPYLYSAAFSTVSTRATTQGWVVRFRIVKGSLAVGGTMTLEVAETFEEATAVPIGEEYLVLTADGAINDDFMNFNVGDIVTLELEPSDPRLSEAQFACGAGDIILRDGQITDAETWDKDLLARSPKTALGITDAGEVIVYAIDGRNANYGNGVKLAELATELRSLGCATAVNLDGGGSTIMAVRTPGNALAATVNRPSDGSPRKVSTYIAFATNNVADAQARNLSLANGGAVVLVGSSIELKYAATDLAYRPAALPSDIAATVVSNKGGSVDDMLYTAPSVAGVDKVTLFSQSTGAVGSGEIFVITQPTSITAQDTDGKTLTSLTLAPGQTMALAPLATYYRKAVTAQPHTFEYEVSVGMRDVVGDDGIATTIEYDEAIGYITEDGVFTAAAFGNRYGEITISAGETAVTLKVTISGFEDTIGHWGAEYIKDLTDRNIVGGTSATTFSPERNIKRGDFVLMLYRAVGQPQPQELQAFDDVKSDAYYAAAIAWAKEVGVTAGVGDGRFAPDAELTREQAFTFVYRALSLLGIALPDGYEPVLEGFADIDAVAGYAQTPTAVLIALGVVGGADGRLTPQSQLTRAQMAKILSVTLGLRGTEITPLSVEQTIPQTDEAEVTEQAEDTGDEDTGEVEHHGEAPPPGAVAVG